MNGRRGPGFGRDWGDDLRQLARRVRAGSATLRLRGIAIGLAAILLLIVVLSSWYTVQPEQTAVVQRFGRVVRVAGPGLHFKLPYGIEGVRLFEEGVLTTQATQMPKWLIALLACLGLGSSALHLRLSVPGNSRWRRGRLRV